VGGVKTKKQKIKLRISDCGSVENQRQETTTLQVNSSGLLGQATPTSYTILKHFED